MSTKRRWSLVVVATLLLSFVVPVSGQIQAADISQYSSQVLTPPFPDSEIVISALDNKQHLPSIAYNSKHREFLVVWHNTWGAGNRDIYAQRITEHGELKSWFAVSSGQKERAQPAVAYDPTRDRYLVTWILDVSGNGTNWDVFGRFIPWIGPDANLKEFVVSDWQSSQWEPRVVYAPTQDDFLVVWTNTPVNVKAYISGRSVFADGSGFRQSKGFTIASHSTENRVHPNLAYNLARNEYIVVYDNGVDVYGIRLRGDSIPLGAGEFGIAGWPDAEENPGVAACSDTDQYLVVWQSLRASGNDIFARYLDGTGLPGNVYKIRDTSVEEREPIVTCNYSGTAYLIAWEQQFSNSSGPYGIWGRMLSSDESLGPSFGIIAPSGFDRVGPALATGHVGYLVSWEHQRDGTIFQDIHGRMIYANRLYLPGILR